MGTQPRSSGRRVGLDGIALVEIALLVELLEEIPEGLDILVIVGDIRVVQVHPVAHLLGEVGPLACVFHDLAATGGVVFIDGDFLADILFGDTEHLLHAEFDRESVCIPTRLTAYLVALHSLEPAEGILDSTRHDMVNTRHSVSRGRPLKEEELRMSLPCGNTLLEQMFLLPLRQHLTA